MSTSQDVDDLKALIANGEATIVVGAGVAKAANGIAPTWIEAVTQALDTALRHTQSTNEHRRLQRRMHGLKLPDADLVKAAETAARSLNAPDGPLWEQFIRDAFGVLKPLNHDLINAIGKTKLRIATTNYDTLIEESLGLRSIASVEEMVAYGKQRDRNSVVHLHGIYDKPESIIWGEKDYKRLTSDVLRGHFQNTISDSGIIFIGCGGTLDDPNFAQWRDFLAAIAAHGAPAFRLYAGVDNHTPSPHFRSVLYGPDHKDLAGFLRSVTPWENYLSKDQTNTLKHLDRSYELAAPYFCSLLLNKLPHSALAGRTNAVLADLKLFAKANIRSIFLYLEMNLFSVSRNSNFSAPTHANIIAIHSSFVRTIFPIELRLFIACCIDVYVEKLMTPVVVEEIELSDFKDRSFDKFLHGSNKVDDGDYRQSGQISRQSEVARQEFEKKFFSSLVPEINNSRAIEWRRSISDAYESNGLHDEFNGGGEDEADSFLGAHYAYEANLPRFSDVVLSDEYFDDEVVLIPKSDLEPWINFVFKGSVVGRDDILIPDEEFRFMDVVETSKLADTFDALCRELEALRSSPVR